MNGYRLYLARERDEAREGVSVCGEMTYFGDDAGKCPSDERTEHGDG